MKFVKRPIVIEAIQFKKGEEDKFRGWLPANAVFAQDTILINTLEGVMTAKVNDWIIKGVNGEFYPCKPDIFEKTYQRA